MPALRNRYESDHRLVTFSELTLARLKRDGKASAAKITGLETDIASTSRDVLNEWFDQADRLAAARRHHGLTGAAFRDFAKGIGIGGSDAFKLERLAGQREVVFAACETMALEQDEPLRYPGWRKALEIALPEIVKVPKGRFGMTPPSFRGFVPNRPQYHIHTIGRTTTEVPAEWQTEGDEWRTPQHLFDFLARHYPFTVDVAATAANRKVKKFYDKARNGLKQDWSNEVVFVNPPYSETGKWTRKAADAAKAGAIVVALLPNRSASGWYRDDVVPSAMIVLLHGRIPFYRRETGRRDITMSGAPFASIVAIWPVSAGERILKYTQPTSTVIMEMPPL
jgi:site-specific DNA-methyltransferase (adenine-specific)